MSETTNGGYSLQSSTKTATNIVTSVALTICAPPTNTASVGAVYNAGSNLTWGCVPGYICNLPKPGHCNGWVDSPDKSYVCIQEFCDVVSADFQTTDWSNSTAYYPTSPGYYNLVPEAFGLTYDIFGYEVLIITEGNTTAIVTTGNWASQSAITPWPAPSISTSSPTQPVVLVGGSRNLTTLPAVCYAACNNAFISAQFDSA